MDGATPRPRGRRGEADASRTGFRRRERGQLISGGQAQRLSLARAFLSDRRILLLDEPISQVDAVSEAAIIDALKEIGPNWTVLVVTHRHSLLAVADSAHQLRDGVLLPLETAGTR